MIRSEKSLEDLIAVLIEGLVFNENAVNITINQSRLIKKHLVISDSVKKELNLSEAQGGRLVFSPSMICLSKRVDFQEDNFGLFGEHTIHFVKNPSFISLGADVYYPPNDHDFESYVHSLKNKTDEEIHLGLSLIQESEHSDEEEFRVVRKIGDNNNRLCFASRDVEALVVSSEQEAKCLKEILEINFG